MEAKREAKWPKVTQLLTTRGEELLASTPQSSKIWAL